MEILLIGIITLFLCCLIIFPFTVLNKSLSISADVLLAAWRLIGTYIIASAVYRWVTKVVNSEVDNDQK